MKARAPGKLVLSGAYAVLDGAPALVAAIDRFAYADAARRQPTSKPEIVAAGMQPDYAEVDTRELFEQGKKLGLGSSAAALVASLALEQQLRVGAVDKEQLFRQALSAHAQVHGGSGVDVAASVYGGLLKYRRDEVPVPHAMPAGVCWSVWSTGRPSSTSDMVTALNKSRLAARIPLQKLADAARRVAESTDADMFLAAMSEQSECLASLESHANLPVFGAEIDELRRAVAERDATLMPAGAGGGDVYVLWQPSARAAGENELLSGFGLTLLQISLEPQGVHVWT